MVYIFFNFFFIKSRHIGNRRKKANIKLLYNYTGFRVPGRIINCGPHEITDKNTFKSET